VLSGRLSAAVASGSAAVDRWAVQPIWTNVVGVVRSLLALSIATTLAVNTTHTLFVPLTTDSVQMNCGILGRANLFCTTGGEHLGLLRLAAVIALLVVASGWRPRWTALIQVWITVSMLCAEFVQDGGDQVALNLSVLLLPVCLTDRRRWHWQNLAHERPSIGAVFAGSALLAARFQVAVIYFQASLAKVGRSDWQQGTAVYYWFTSPRFGFGGWAAPLTDLLRFAPVVALVSWGTIGLELSLAVGGLFGGRRVRHVLFALGVLMHLGIAVFLGLPTFAVSMFAALIVLTRRPAEAFAWPRRRRVPETADPRPETATEPLTAV
jgi:antimicrobial peptide system SdpB family protein